MLKIMKPTIRVPNALWIPLLLAALTGLGCETDTPARPAATGKAPADDTPAAKKVPAGRNVWLEIRGEKRRVFINAFVCLREGQLEHLMCRKRTKEHEAILAAAVDAADIHKALMVAKAVPGSTVRYEPKYQPATGTQIKITLQYEDKGKLVTVPAQQWIRNSKTGKDLDTNWVFAGSLFQEDPDDKNKPPFYAANSGDVICVSNFEGAMLDLPINSPKDNSDLAFEAHTERIPPLETKVTVILEPILEEKKK
jgi:hypothetical protein